MSMPGHTVQFRHASARHSPALERFQLCCGFRQRFLSFVKLGFVLLELVLPLQQLRLCCQSPQRVADGLLLCRLPRIGELWVQADDCCRRIWNVLLSRKGGGRGWLPWATHPSRKHPPSADCRAVRPTDSRLAHSTKRALGPVLEGLLKAVGVEDVPAWPHGAPLRFWVAAIHAYAALQRHAFIGQRTPGPCYLPVLQ